MARNHPTKEQYREGARDRYGEIGHPIAGSLRVKRIEVPEKASVSRNEAERGAWVQAIVWVRDEDVTEEQ